MYLTITKPKEPGIKIHFLAVAIKGDSVEFDLYEGEGKRLATYMIHFPSEASVVSRTPSFHTVTIKPSLMSGCTLNISQNS